MPTELLKSPDSTTQAMQTSKASATTHDTSHSVTFELISLATPSSANSEHMTVYQTTSVPCYTPSVSPTSMDPQGIYQCYNIALRNVFVI